MSADDVGADDAALRAVAEAAAQGPWTWHEYGGRDGAEPVPYLTGRGGDPETYAYDTEVIEPDHHGECGCRSACTLELRVRPEDRAHIATFDPPTVLGLLDRLAAVPRPVTQPEGNRPTCETCDGYGVLDGLEPCPDCATVRTVHLTPSQPAHGDNEAALRTTLHKAFHEVWNPGSPLDLYATSPIWEAQAKAVAALAAVPRPVTQPEGHQAPLNMSGNMHPGSQVECRQPECATSSQPAHGEATGGLECDSCGHRGPRDPDSGECGSCGGRSFSPWGDQIDPPLLPPAHGEALTEAEQIHLTQHLTDGVWHDQCGFCRVRRSSGGTGLAAQPAHGDNEAALARGLCLTQTEVTHIKHTPPEVPCPLHLALARAALSASAVPEGGEGR